MLVLPLPFQGHVNPLMNFSLKLARHGFKVSFVNTEFNHKRIMSSLLDSNNPTGSALNFVTIPDGLEPEDDRKDVEKVFLAMSYTMPALLEKLIKDIAYDGKHRISCIVADMSMGWALEVARKLGIRSAIFYPAAAAMFALQFNIPRLINEGIIGSEGKEYELSLSIHYLFIFSTREGKLLLLEEGLKNELNCRYGPPNLSFLAKNVTL